jgi:hypothetical protein
MTWLCKQSDENSEMVNVSHDDVELCIKGSRNICPIQKMIRFETKLSRSEVLKGQLGSKSNEKENASNKNAIKTRNSMSLTLE